MIEGLDEALLAWQRRYIKDVLAEANNDVNTAARIAGVSRNHFYKLINKCNVPRERIRRSGGNAAWRELGA